MSKSFTQFTQEIEEEAVKKPITEINRMNSSEDITDGSSNYYDLAAENELRRLNAYLSEYKDTAVLDPQETYKHLMTTLRTIGVVIPNVSLTQIMSSETVGDIEIDAKLFPHSPDDEATASLDNPDTEDEFNRVTGDSLVLKIYWRMIDSKFYIDPVMTTQFQLDAEEEEDMGLDDDDDDDDTDSGIEESWILVGNARLDEDGNPHSDNTLQERQDGGKERDRDEYDKFFQKMLDKEDKSLEDMSEKEKEKFFEKVDKEWKTEKERKKSVKVQEEGDTEYDKFVQKMLDKEDKSLEDMSDKEQKEFWNKVDKKWNSDSEEGEDGKVEEAKTPEFDKKSLKKIKEALEDVGFKQDSIRTDIKNSSDAYVFAAGSEKVQLRIDAINTIIVIEGTGRGSLDKTLAEAIRGSLEQKDIKAKYSRRIGALRIEDSKDMIVENILSDDEKALIESVINSSNGQ